MISRSKQLELSKEIAQFAIDNELDVNQITKSDLVKNYPDVEDLIEVPEHNYAEWAKHNEEHKSFNMFKTLIAFEFTVIKRTSEKA